MDVYIRLFATPSQVRSRKACCLEPCYCTGFGVALDEAAGSLAVWLLSSISIFSEAVIRRCF